MFNTVDMAVENKQHRKSILGKKKHHILKSEEEKPDLKSAKSIDKEGVFLKDIEVKRYFSSTNKISYVVRFILKPCKKEHPEQPIRQEFDSNASDLKNIDLSKIILDSKSYCRKECPDFVTKDDPNKNLALTNQISTDKSKENKQSQTSLANIQSAKKNSTQTIQELEQEK